MPVKRPMETKRYGLVLSDGYILPMLLVVVFLFVLVVLL